MTVWGFVKAVVTAPFLGAICAAIGWVNAGTIVFLDFVVHWAFGLEQGLISQVLLVVAKHLPLVFGVFGFMGAFVSEVPVQSVFGTARWASAKDIASMVGKHRAGLIIGRDPQTKALLRYDGPSHLMTMAPTRTGKGVGTIIPNLLTAQRSVICIDPKGENARITARAREGFGALHVLDPFGVTDRPSSCFNPFAHLDANDVDIAEHAGTLADALVYDEPGSSGDVHWNEEARALIAGLIMMVVASEPPHLRHPATLRDYLTRPPKAFADLLTRMQESDRCDGLIARAANRHLGKSDCEASGVLSSIGLLLCRSEAENAVGVPGAAAGQAWHLCTLAAIDDQPEPDGDGRDAQRRITTRERYPARSGRYIILQAEESRSRKQVRAVPARRVCKPWAVGGCRACHGADGRLRRAALADPSGHSSAACSLWQRCKHLPCQCRRAAGVWCE